MGQVRMTSAGRVVRRSALDRVAGRWAERRLGRMWAELEASTAEVEPEALVDGWGFLERVPEEGAVTVWAAEPGCYPFRVRVETAEDAALVGAWLGRIAGEQWGGPAL